MVMNGKFFGSFGADVVDNYDAMFRPEVYEKRQKSIALKKLNERKKQKTISRFSALQIVALLAMIILATIGGYFTYSLSKPIMDSFAAITAKPVVPTYYQKSDLRKSTMFIPPQYDAMIEELIRFEFFRSGLSIENYNTFLNLTSEPEMKGYRVLILSLAKTESNLKHVRNPNRYGRKIVSYDHGIMQVNSMNLYGNVLWDELGIMKPKKKFKEIVADDNLLLTIGIKFFTTSLAKNGFNVLATVNAYNGGPKAIRLVTNRDKLSTKQKRYNKAFINHVLNHERLVMENYESYVQYLEKNIDFINKKVV